MLSVCGNASTIDSHVYGLYRNNAIVGTDYAWVDYGSAYLYHHWFEDVVGFPMIPGQGNPNSNWHQRTNTIRGIYAVWQSTVDHAAINVGSSSQSLSF